METSTQVREAIERPAARSLEPNRFAAMHDYRFVELTTPEGITTYDSLVGRTYQDLGFITETAASFLPRAGTRRFGLVQNDLIVGVCALNRVTEPEAHVRQVVYGAGLGDANDQIVEINNLVLEKSHRGLLGVSLILYNCAEIASRDGFDLITGVTRYQTLKYFVDAGATPILHEPLHVLGRDGFEDFVVYYDLRRAGARAYLQERAMRLLHQLQVMREIRERYGPQDRRHGHAISADA